MSPRVAGVIIGVAEETGVPVKAMLSASRRVPDVTARHLAMARIRAISRSDGRPKFTLAMIGGYFNRGYSAVSYALRIAANRLRDEVTG